MSTESPTVFVVDDDPIACKAVEALATSVKLRTESFTTAETFLAAFDLSRAGCVVLDECLPGSSGLEVQRRLLDKGSTLPVVFISAYANVRMAVQAMRYGAMDVLEKPYQDEDLLEAILNGVRANWEARERHLRRRQVQARLDRLTPGESDALALILEGCSNKVIATRLGVSLRTVENRRHEIFAKTETKSVAELVQFVLTSRSQCTS